MGDGLTRWVKVLDQSRCIGCDPVHQWWAARATATATALHLAAPA
jgi:hypothetical protein